MLLLDDRGVNPFSSDDDSEEENDEEIDEREKKNNEKDENFHLRHNNSKLLKSFNMSNWRKNRHEREQFFKSNGVIFKFCFT